MSQGDRPGLAGAVHDVNNALQSIGASLNLIGRRLPPGCDPQIGRLLQSAQTQVGQAGLLVRRILDGAGPAEERVDLYTVVKEMAPQIEALMGDAIAFDLQADGAQLPVLCDPLRLRSGVLNAVLNARDAMDGGGRLTIGVRRVMRDGAGAFVEVAVTDTGDGMDEAFARHAFEPFVTTKAPGRGTGLGLFQLQRFAESARGFVSLASRKGAGTSVSILLPLTE